MDRELITVTVFFEEPFWVAVVEQVSEGKLSVCRVVFGAEPRDYEVYEYLKEHYYRLQFSPAVETGRKETGRNPKRIQREARRQTERSGIGTRSQEALKLQQEQRRSARKVSARERKDAVSERQFQLKQQKKKEKHRGR
ncbi:YjdF family protein [Qiania dongpingensis]|uniref:YjdF family protein n=1 Tax=Qiania dongpingensis TaxID=2763669 RepID=A0A7G9G2Y8_9FIRM|nr:YjdF family protein [Qiania dongpingensis]QNM05170.1 YjdF family protein [Qiania dongpingensis]